MNRLELRAELSTVINFNAGQTNQDYTEAQLNAGLQYAYNLEVEKAKIQAGSKWFKKAIQATWAADTTTFSVPAAVNQANLLAVYDITNADPGLVLTIADVPEKGTDAWWFDNQTLRWIGSDGPSSALTLRLFYLANAETLIADTQVPALLPPQYHSTIVWSAAVYLRELGDESAPQSFMKNLNEWRLDMWKVMSKGRPATNSSSIMNQHVEEDYVY